MFSQIAVSNIINNVLNNNTFLNLCSNNLFNLLLTKIDTYNITKLASSPFIGMLNDNPIDFSQKINNLHLQYHVPALLFFHNESPKALKKEDKYILSQKLSNTIKVFFDSNIRNSWGLTDDNCHTISYGVEHKKTTKTQDVIVLNSSNNPNIKNIYQHIKNTINNCDMLTVFDDYDNVLELIGNYKIAICLENFYDVLCCCSAECKVITNINTNNSLSSVLSINDYDSIIPNITTILDNRDDNLYSTIDYLNNNYKLETFIHSMKLILSNFSAKAYKHEA
jgi:hypothetical protein